MVAYVVDSLIVFLVVGLIAAAAFLPALIMGQFLPGGGGSIPIFGGFLPTITSILLILYFAFAETYYGSSIGKQVMGLKVMTDTGGRPDFVTALIRNVSKIYWILLLIDVVVGLAMGTEYTKRFSDRYAHTSVASK